MSKLVTGYSLALFEISQEEKKLEKYKDEAQFLIETLSSNTDYLRVLNSEIKTKEKHDSLKSVFKTKISKIMYNFLFLLIDKGRILHVVEILRRFVSLSNKELKIIEGVVYSADELTKVQLEKITKNTSDRLGSKISLINKVDKELIGGIKVIVDDEVIDASVTGMLQEMKAKLLQGKEA